MAALGVPPHVADKILNHQSGTISGVAAVYQRHEFMTERKEALMLWGSHLRSILTLPVFACAGKTVPPFLRCLSQTSAGKRT